MTEPEAGQIPPAAPDPQPAPPVAPVAPSVSPGRAAWRRLRRNLLAMAGLGWALVITVLCFAAPWFTAHDPDLELPWIGARPPGASHPDVFPGNRFLRERPPETSPTLLAAMGPDGGATFAVEETVWTDYRISLRRGRIMSVQLERGARLLPELDLREAVAYELLAGDQLGERLGGVWTAGQDPPEGSVDPSQRVLYLRVAEGEPVEAEWRLELADGVVADITREGEPRERFIADGEDVRAVVVDGRTVERSHLLGTDSKGRDLWSRILYGGRISLTVGVVATAVSLLIGVIYGAISGFVGGRTDRSMMSTVDILYGLPFMFLVILLLVSFGRSMIVLFVALGAVQWLTMARIVRGQVLSLRHREFIDAARLAGAGPVALIGRHLIPNCLGPIIVYTSLTVPVVILEESFLAFLGLQVEWNDQALDSWGALVWQGRAELGLDGERSWLLLWPAAIMTATLLALNTLGDGLRDALDPQLKGRD